MYRKAATVVIFAFFFLSVCTSEVRGTWSKYLGNPVLTGSPGAWDERDVQNGKMIKEGGSLSKWYAGNKGSG